ncbi:MAG: DinB family protein [Chloroflexi bacterium]|nr:DinB family protein [Chloroflexota bacterium]
MTSNQEQIPALQQMLRSAHQVVMDSIDGIAEPEIRQVPAPDEWTVAQLLAHIAEIEYFWMEKAVLITKETDPNITRSDVENDRRTAAIVDHAGDSLSDLIQGLTAANESAIATTGEIPPGDLATLGHRGENNPITVEGVVHFLASHMEEHASQIRECRRLISQDQ